MKNKMVKQYICDFCGKKGLSATHMKRHETYCTKNPQRGCRMCNVADTLVSHKRIIEMLPVPVIEEGEFGDKHLLNAEIINGVLRNLKADDDYIYCPACVLAALRQKGVLVRSTEFDFKKECADFWKEHNERNAHEEY